MANKYLTAALCAATLCIFINKTFAQSSSSFSLNNGEQLTITTNPLTELNRTAIQNIVDDTVFNLDNRAPESLVNQLNSTTDFAAPEWLFSAIAQCERWHQKTESRFSCRNGNLKQYWHDYVHGQGLLERREARKLARSARVAKVTLSADTRQVVTDSELVWDFGDLTQAIILQRIIDYLASQDITAYHLQIGLLNAFSGHDTTWPHQTSLAGNQQSLTLRNTISYEIAPWQQSAYQGSTEQGVISHNDGWPASKFASHVLSENPIDAVVLGYLAASNTSRFVLSLLDSEKQHLALRDQQQRVYYSKHYQAFTGVSPASMQQVKIRVRLPEFDIADYQGPYAAVWITDTENKLLRNLHIRGTGENWLKDLRTWWRKIARKDDSLIDAMSGATMGNKPIEVNWDGLDQYGKDVHLDNLLLHVEIAREHGGRTYKKIPLSIRTDKSPLNVEGENELHSVQIAF
ncbi:DUF2271 domain-containing protein [Planctobacterium marinum]|uniref:DUF2271 domain-containing protein n=1 Tax=Planctobacterium marinum TaxID=1631968 RepID=UPI001E3C4C99|nr:DUF2271 domain-containing protein [Planctobacterium marinum]MCC2603954.1 DUF2271 domain-containing protein [Planctobacterium marinum]